METPLERGGGDRFLINRASIQAWRLHAPWPSLRQVEQDLLICRALCDLFNAPTLKGRIVSRGGIAINKLLFDKPLRYSEDIDLVQTPPEPIGSTIDAIREALSWMGFDLHQELESLRLDPDQLIACFEHYLRQEGVAITRALAEERMLKKLVASLTDDIGPLPPAGIRFDERDALAAFESVWRLLVLRIKRDGRELTPKVLEEFRAKRFPELPAV